MENLDVAALREMGIEMAATWGLKVLGAITMLLVGRMLAKALRRSLMKFFDRTEFDETLEVFLASLVYWVFQIFVVLAVLGIFGIETTSVVAVLGAGVFAAGLAMQGTLSNFSSGVMLLIFRPFKVGDFVEVGGVSGTVSEIGIFTTSLNTGDNVHIIVPNSSIYGEIVKNYAVNDTRRNDMTIGISYDDNIGTAIEVVRRILAADSRVLADPEALVAVGELADSSVNLVVRPWCKREDYAALRRDLLKAFKEELEAAGCSLPYPQTDVHLIQAAPQ